MIPGIILVSQLAIVDATLDQLREDVTRAYVFLDDRIKAGDNIEPEDRVLLRRLKVFRDRLFDQTFDEELHNLVRDAARQMV